LDTVPENVMEIDVVKIVEGFVDIDRTPVEELMATTIDTGDVKYSKFSIPAFPDLEQGKILASKR